MDAALRVMSPTMDGRSIVRTITTMLIKVARIVSLTKRISCRRRSMTLNQRKSQKNATEPESQKPQHRNPASPRPTLRRRSVAILNPLGIRGHRMQRELKAKKQPKQNLCQNNSCHVADSCVNTYTSYLSMYPSYSEFSIFIFLYMFSACVPLLFFILTYVFPFHTHTSFSYRWTLNLNQGRHADAFRTDRARVPFLTASRWPACR